MTRVLQQLLRLAVLLIGVSATSVALAVATVDVTFTGPQANETTIKLFDNNNNPVPPVVQTRDRFSVKEAGAYTVEVYVGDKLIMIDGQRRQTITIAEGNNQLSVNSETGKVDVIPPVAMPKPIGVMSGFNFTISGGADSTKDKPPTTGVFVGPDTALLGGRSHITTNDVDFHIQFLKEEPSQTGQLEPGWDLDFGESWSDPSNSIQVPVGTKTGWAYWMPAPNGSTGISSSGGANAEIKTRFSEGHVNGSLPYLLKKQAPWSVLGVPMLGFQHFEFTYNASISNLTVPGVSSTTDQKMKEDEFSAGYGVLGLYTFPNRAWAGAGAGLKAIYYHARYNGTQDNLCVVCAPPTDHYSVSTSGSKSGVTWGASVNAVVGFPVAQNADLFLLGTYDYHDKSGVVTSKVTPSDDAPHLRTASRESASAQLGLRVKF